MKIFENYNSAKQKYGEKLVTQMANNGIPDKYLLSACRFYAEKNVPIQHLQHSFRQWMTYVVKNDKSIDVNKLDYDEFQSVIQSYKNKYCVANVIYSDETGTFGKLNNAKDVQRIPTKNQWCIKSQNWFNRYTEQGYEFYVIYLPNESYPFEYVIAAVVNGNVEYYDSQDYEQFEDLRPEGDVQNSDHSLYQNKLPKQILSYLYNIAASQTEAIELKTENKEYKTSENMSKNKIRLTENELKEIVAESVRKLTCEVSIDTLQRASQIANDNLHNNVYSTDDEKKRRTKQWMNIASQERLKYKALEKETMRLMHKYFEEFKDLDKAYREMKDAMDRGYLNIGNNIGSYNY